MHWWFYWAVLLGMNIYIRNEWQLVVRLFTSSSVQYPQYPSDNSLHLPLLVRSFFCSRMDKSPVRLLKAYTWNNTDAPQVMPQSLGLSRFSFHICIKAARLAFDKCSLMLCVLQPADAFQHTWKLLRGVWVVGKWKGKIDVCVWLCEEDDDCPIFGKAPFFLGKTLRFYSSTEGPGLNSALVATSLRTFIEVCDGC